jgi:hypothetical protein
LRALAAAREHLNDAVARLYTALGARRHEQGGAGNDATIAEAVAEAALPESVASAVHGEDLDGVVRAEHEASRDAVRAARSPRCAVARSSGLSSCPRRRRGRCDGIVRGGPDDGRGARIQRAQDVRNPF